VATRLLGGADGNPLLMTFNNLDNMPSQQSNKGNSMAEKKATTPFDPIIELEKIKALRAKQRKRQTWGKSKLQPFLGEMLALQQTGASYTELTQWLHTQRRIKAHKSTVQRFLKKAGDQT